MSANIDFVIGAKDKASAPLRTAADSMSRLQRAAQSASATISAAASRISVRLLPSAARRLERLRWFL